jgi:dolichol-phosphate mannosyltransferase
LVRKKKEGLGRAYISGFKWALERNYQKIIQMDADFSHKPEYIKDMLEASEKYDLVIGSRYLNGISVVNWPLRRLMLSYFANKFARFMSRTPI